jgi:hypothetical protein
MILRRLQIIDFNEYTFDSFFGIDFVEWASPPTSPNHPIKSHIPPLNGFAFFSPANSNTFDLSIRGIEVFKTKIFKS